MIDYARSEHSQFDAASSVALNDATLQTALVRLTETLLAGHRKAFAALPEAEQLRHIAKRIKEHTLANLDAYLEQLEGSVQRAGGRVHWAPTATDACRTIIEIAARTGCRRAVKSKSMTSEEIHLNAALA